MTSPGPVHQRQLLGPAEWDALERRGYRRGYERGEVLFFEGDPGGSVVALREGRAKVSVQTLPGRELLLAVKGPGELLGEMSALDGRPRSATATAMEPVQALVVSASVFHEFLGAHPQVTLRLLRTLVTELRETDKLLADRDAGDTISRTAIRLVYLAGRYGEHNGGGTHVGLDLTHEDLASWIGVSREAASRALSQLRGAGYITTERRSITVTDLAGLRRYVAERT
ncbi:MAG TPA: Crp/Fnr family transcriptional regulator [Pseudonocardiaceae bacterium]|nr:Crp/Fnr family transcriptional regulator [Pseudonocardiaceae bacterium]